MIGQMWPAIAKTFANVAAAGAAAIVAGVVARHVDPSLGCLA